MNLRTCDSIQLFIENILLLELSLTGAKERRSNVTRSYRLFQSNETCNTTIFNRFDVNNLYK